METPESGSSATGSYDKSRVLDVKPLRCLVPMFASPPVGSQGSPSFVYSPPFGPFPPGSTPFYPFFNPSEHQKPVDATPNNHHQMNANAPSFQTPPPPPPSFDAEAGSSRKRSINLEAGTQSYPDVVNRSDGWKENHKFEDFLSRSGNRSVSEEDNWSNNDVVKKQKPRAPKRVKTSSEIKFFSPADGDSESVRDVLMKFDALRRRISQIEDARETSSGNRRADLRAGAILMSKGLRTNSRRRTGTVPGVEIGDIFFFRIELCLVGLHAPSMAGIDYMSLRFDHEDETIAVSIVSSGGYGDEMEDKDVLIYSGQGGNFNKKDLKVSDQKLERGNLALERSLRRGNEVRVIRGVRDLLNPTGKIYYYDGLYKIQESWMEKGKSGAQVFKYKLLRLPGQPEAFAIWKAIQQWKENTASRPGLILPDLTSGAEKLPVSLVNDVDNDKGPAHFTYYPTIQYPKPLTSLKTAFGCQCQGACVPGNPNCSCVMRNGGDHPHTNNGVLVIRKPLIYECGPSCHCYPNCKNQVSQSGLKYRLEVFKTKDRGWGLRSWDPIRAGSFICEYAGQVIDKKYMKEGGLEDDDYDYVLDTSYAIDNSLEWNYMPELLEEERPDQSNNDLQKSLLSVVISAKKIGNVARFMNHSCTPNVLWQPVLYEHNDESYPHIMFYAMKHIPPMTELTYDYGLSGAENNNASGRRKKCLCGSSRCRGHFG